MRVLSFNSATLAARTSSAKTGRRFSKRALTAPFLAIVGTSHSTSTKYVSQSRWRRRAAAYHVRIAVQQAHTRAIAVAEHVYKHPEDDTRFYAVFSTSTSGIQGSAICTFSLDAIQEVFNGKFKEQATSSSAWLPVLSSKVPEPRPGVCVNDTQALPDSVLNFIRGHPLMDSTVSQDNGQPVFYKRDVIFTRLVVDKVEVDGVFYTVYFAGTSTGLVYKLIEWVDGIGEARSNVVDIFEATSPEPVRAMEISAHHKSLYVSSDSQV